MRLGYVDYEILIPGPAARRPTRNKRHIEGLAFSHETGGAVHPTHTSYRYGAENIEGAEATDFVGRPAPARVGNVPLGPAVKGAHKGGDGGDRKQG